MTTDSIQGLDRAGLRSALQGYSSALLAHLRANLPSAIRADLIGGAPLASVDQRT